MKNRKTIGLALGSGAYRGFAHIGVIRSLEKNGIPIDYLSGASIGAWVGAYYAAFKNLSGLERDLIGDKKERISLLFDLSSTSGIIGGQKFSSYLEKKLQRYNFSDLKIPLQITATNLIDGQTFIFKEGDVAQAVRASTAIPLVFNPLSHKNKLLVDGSLSNPVPCDLLKEMGADIIIGVNLYNKNEFSQGRPTISDIAWRSSVIMLYNLAQFSLRATDIAIEPDTSLFTKANSLDKYFNQNNAQKMIAIGEKAADEAIPAIKRLLN